jgi:conjugative relaxase-like TrwC/TraI family protein
VLSVGRLAKDQETYYLSEVIQGREDYYLNAGEAPGRWTGRLAETLGLSGEVGADDLRTVLAGGHPSTGLPLRSSVATLPGFDLTLSSPKGISVTWALADRATAEQIVAAHDRGIDAAITYLERHATRVRRGHAGAELVDGDGFVAAAFRHRTSRLGDPQLHTHVLVANMSRGPDGRWTALDSRSIYAHARTAGFVYQAILRDELARSVGFLFEDVTQGHADIAGVPRDLRRHFSQRRREIAAAMEQNGATSARGAQVATLATRQAKGERLSESELRALWAESAREFEFAPEKLPRFVRVPIIDATDDDLATVLTEHDATFARRDAVRAVAEAATQGASLDAIEERADGFLESEQAISLAPDRWTTPEILALEHRTVDLAVSGQASDRGLATYQATSRALTERPSLGEDQRAAVEAITRSGNAVDVVIGPAGTGKTFLLDAARAAWEASGKRVIGTGLAARAAAELTAGSGIPSVTADRLLRYIEIGRERFDESTVLLVDEAGMLGTRRLAALVREAAESGSKIVLVGDPRQLPEIDAGGLFSGLASRLGFVELTENRRQRDPEERAVAAELRAGRVRDAIARLDHHGEVTVADNADVLRDGMVGEWHAARVRGEDVLMIAGRRAAVADLNERARELRIANGELGPEVFAIDERRFALDDEVLANRNDYGLGLLNNDRGVLVGAGEDALIVRLDDGRQVDVPFAYVEEGDLTHGYATTVHKGQGVTCDAVLVLGDDSFTNETAYTALTRGRTRNALYLVEAPDPERHGAAVEIDALATFTDAIARSGAKTAAIDVASRELPVIQPEPLVIDF